MTSQGMSHNSQGRDKGRQTFGCWGRRPAVDDGITSAVAKPSKNSMPTPGPPRRRLTKGTKNVGGEKITDVGRKTPGPTLPVSNTNQGPTQAQAPQHNPGEARSTSRDVLEPEELAKNGSAGSMWTEITGPRISKRASTMSSVTDKTIVGVGFMLGLDKKDKKNRRRS